MQIPKGTLVMLVKRGNEFLIPNGQMELKPGDKLLLISENKTSRLINSQPTCFSNIHEKSYCARTSSLPGFLLKIFLN